MKKREVKLLDKHTEKLRKQTKQSQESSEDKESVASKDSWSGEPRKTPSKSKNEVPQSDISRSPKERTKKPKKEEEFLSFADIEDSAYNV